MHDRITRSRDLDPTLRLRDVTVTMRAELRHITPATRNAETAFDALRATWPNAYAVEGDESDRLIARVFADGRCVATIAEGVGAEVLP